MDCPCNAAIEGTDEQDSSVLRLPGSASRTARTGRTYRHRAPVGLAVGEVNVSVGDVASLQCQQFAAAATGEREQADGSDAAAPGVGTYHTTRSLCPSILETGEGDPLESATWSTSLYNLICYGSDEEGIFHSQAGTSAFLRERVLRSGEYTPDELVARYGEDLGRLAEFPALVVAETGWGDRPRARLSRVMNIHAEGRNVHFEYQHLETDEFTSQDVFGRLNLTFDQWERARTHWAVKRGDVVARLLEFFASRSRRERPTFFEVKEWPLPILGHVAVMMPFDAQFDPVYEAITDACGSLHVDTRRVDELHGPRRIVDDIFAIIMQSAVVVSDITGMNPNVLYETGLAHARNRDVILITQDSTFPFDISSYRVVKYLSDTEGLVGLRNDLRESLRSVGL